jgi:hypothetical protein
MPPEGAAQPEPPDCGLRSGALHQALGFAFQLKPRILMGFAASDGCNALHEVKDAFRLAVFLAEDGFNDLRCFGLGETILAQKTLAILIRAGDDLLPCSLDAGKEWRGRGIGETRERRRRLVSKTLCGKFGMPNRDLLEILDTPEIAIHAHRPEIKRSDAERLRSDFRVPAIEAPEIQVR